MPPRGEGSRRVGGILAGAARGTKTFRHPLGFRASIVYNRTISGRRNTGEFFDKLVAEVCGGWGDGARGGRASFQFSVFSFQRWRTRDRDSTELCISQLTLAARLFDRRELGVNQKFDTGVKSLPDKGL